mgnify:CR=1 FL=1
MDNVCAFVVFFFFQAEDGIRDLVRSRGLGDVYKRQVKLLGTKRLSRLSSLACESSSLVSRVAISMGSTSVSYTHLTLPTIYSV